MEEIEERNNFKRDFVGIAVAVQIIFFINTYAHADFLISLLNNPAGRTTAIFLLLWQALGLALYAYSPVEPKRKILFSLQTILLLIVFLAPLSFAYIVRFAVNTSTMAM
ncbi:MAG: hypothetical protein SFY67_01810 [Candidatus Melainabacteria bacterium]|nr:hypothetical protein [Candidatus Melainabacteria bacterium]